MRRTRLDYISRKWLGWALFLYALKTLVFSHVFASELPSYEEFMEDSKILTYDEYFEKNTHKFNYCGSDIEY